MFIMKFMVAKKCKHYSRNYSVQRVWKCWN